MTDEAALETLFAELEATLRDKNRDRAFELERPRNDTRRVTRRGPRLRGHPRLSCVPSVEKAWMAGTSPGHDSK
jgi:hypothetical protein